MQSEIVSIVMPAYNAEEYIGEAIESVLAQTYPLWELIIVNDGSTDRTPDIVTQYSDTRIRVFHQANSGESAARNTALSHLRGELVSFLDADDLYMPNHLEQTVRYLQDHPDRGGVFTDGFYIDEKGARLRPLSSRRRGPFEGDIFEDVVRSSDLFGAPVCLVLRRDVITSHGLKFDPGIIIGPDWDFLTRYSEVAQFGYIDQPTCLYRIHLTNISVRTGLERRALDLAKCRINAIQLQRFAACSTWTRYSVFYDLLVNLLRGYPEDQSRIIEGPQFKGLAKPVQARLLRLMAGMALVHGVDQAPIGQWLKEARCLNSGDWKSWTVSTLYRLRPGLLKVLLRLKSTRRPDPRTVSPFADLKTVRAS